MSFEKQISRAVLSGIRAARIEHNKMSRRYFGLAPEYWIATAIARSLAKIGGCTVELEASVRDAMSDSKAIKRGRVPSWMSGRFDIVLRDKRRNAPRALIEVKHPLRKSAISATAKDAKRIISALQRAEATGHLECGCVAFYCHSAPGDKKKKAALNRVKNDLKNLDEKAQTLAAKNGCRAHLKTAPADVDRVHNAKGKHTRWGKACCVLIKRKLDTSG